MNLKEQVRAWLDQESERISEDKNNQELHAAFTDENPTELDAHKEELLIQLVVDNLKSMPHLKFHAQKNLFPYPDSKQLQKAKEIVFPQESAKLTH